MNPCAEVMTTIRLGGALGKVFGKIQNRVIRDTRETVRALNATLPGFEIYLNSSKSRGLTYAVYVGGRNIGKQDLNFQNIGREMQIVPVGIGSKKAGLVQTILGTMLVSASILRQFIVGWDQEDERSDKILMAFPYAYSRADEAIFSS